MSLLQCSDVLLGFEVGGYFLKRKRDNPGDTNISTTADIDMNDLLFLQKLPLPFILNRIWRNVCCRSHRPANNLCRSNTEGVYLHIRAEFDPNSKVLYRVDWRFFFISRLFICCSAWSAEYSFTDMGVCVSTGFGFTLRSDMLLYLRGDHRAVQWQVSNLFGPQLHSPCSKSLAKYRRVVGPFCVVSNQEWLTRSPVDYQANGHITH